MANWHDILAVPIEKSMALKPGNPHNESVFLRPARRHGLSTSSGRVLGACHGQTCPLCLSDS